MLYSHVGNLLEDVGKIPYVIVWKLAVSLSLTGFQSSSTAWCVGCLGRSQPLVQFDGL